MELYILSGTSGSGKSIALHALEDLGFYCIDNLPIALLPLCVHELSSADGVRQAYNRAAIGIDARTLSKEVDSIPKIVSSLSKDGVEVRILFLDANDEILIKRFSETRRKHPLTSSGSLPLEEAIIQERIMLQPISSQADRRFDTSRSNVHQLRDMIQNDAGREPGKGMSVLIQSFGFKHGMPIEADFVFDVRCLPNPHWEPRLRPQTGRDEGVQRFLERHDLVQDMYTDIYQFIARWLDAFQADRRSYLTVAVGCTGGQHRSVYFAERLAKQLSEGPYPVQVRHRELS